MIDPPNPDLDSPVPDPFAEPAPAVGLRGRHIDAAASAGDRTYALFMHLMLPIATLTVLPIVLGPLVMWLVKKNESPFINDHGKEALNFNISVVIYIILSALLVPLCGVGFFVMGAVWVLAFVFSVIAAVAANHGEWYRYPACIRIIG